MKTPIFFPFILYFSLFISSCSSNHSTQNKIKSFHVEDIGVYQQMNTETNKDDEKVFVTVEQMPSFPGGESEFSRFIHKNLNYPILDREMGVQGRVTVRFIVTKTGEIRNIESLKNQRSILADSLIQAIKKMPRWIPGKQDGKEVDVYFTLPLYICTRN